MAPARNRHWSRRFRAAFGIGGTGAALIRPDGYVAWRALELPVEPAAELAAALRQMACVAR